MRDKLKHYTAQPHVGKGSTPHKGGNEANSRRERTRVFNSSVTTQCEPSPSTALLNRTRVGATPHKGGNEDHCSTTQDKGKSLIS